MNDLVLIAIMFLVVFGIRLTGMLAHRVQIPETCERALGYAPVAVISAITAVSLSNQASSDSIRLLAAGGAALIMLAVGRIWACILGGLGLFWLLRFLLG
jgi:branched-subunit amino acid transport protein